MQDISPTQLSAKVALALLCVVRSGGWLSPTTVGVLDGDHPRFAPFPVEFYNSIPLAVITNQLAAPSPDSPPEGFINDTAGSLTWRLEGVHWQLLMRNPSNFVHELELLIASRAWPLDWTEELRKFWHELAIAECIEFAVVIALKRELPIPCDLGLTQLLKNLLVDYSVSQIFELLQAAIEDTADFVARGYITPKRAENFIVGACQRRADRARADGSTIEGLQRDPMLGRTQASYLLHDVFLGHGEDGFFQVIPRA
ncbi:MAG TPA: hypothetical protein VLC92_14195 [Rhodocyclaceae bacterium]|nr:hypothetical protein [Rhodocyclaceae bacterium]